MLMPTEQCMSRWNRHGARGRPFRIVFRGNAVERAASAARRSREDQQGLRFVASEQQSHRDAERAAAGKALWLLGKPAAAAETSGHDEPDCLF